jgi:serine/threonine protein kinase/tetratricopeptide (TPR) repeat protein
MIGQTLGHYKIIDKIGAGGMGVVYRSHDEQLDRDVALKVLPIGTIADEHARKQFRTEALALARLNHPNIETIHEFGTQDGIDFLVMELIPGRALSEKIKEGPLSQQEILRIAVQFAAGLAAAHEQGIIHRDLKPGNLIVTPDGRLKILDFGLAKLFRPEIAGDVTQTITGENGTTAGTLPYMSPEQLRGLSLDPRSDIYAAGNVIYEIATGRRPFPQTQTAELMGAILHKTPDRPSSLNPEISPALESIICKALEKEPMGRYHTARELGAALEGLSAPGSQTHPVGFHQTATLGSTTRSAISRRGLVAIGSIFAIILLAGLFIGLNVDGIRDRILSRNYSRPLDGGITAPSPVKARRSVAVLGFKNVSNQPDKAWMSTAISDMLTTELAAGEQLRTIPGESVAQMKVSLSLPEMDTYGSETLRKIHKNLNADDVVLGSYIPLGNGQIRLDLRLQDASQGETLASVSEKGSENQLDDLVGRAGAELRAKLGAGAVSGNETMEVKATIPSNSEAARLYSEGVARLRSFDNLTARDFLEKAVIAQPNFALAHSALASAWSGLGYDTMAKAEAKKALDLAGGLSREDRLLVEARYGEMTKEWDKAAEAYRTLFGFFPDNLEYGIRLANSQTRAGNGKEALVTVESMRRRVPSSVQDDPRIDLAAADASVSLGDFKLAQSLASRAAQSAQAKNMELILARAHFLQGLSLEGLGQNKEATTAIKEARQLYAAAGDKNGVASTLEVMGNILSDHGDPSAALPKYQEELAIVRDVGNRRAEASALNNLALVLDEQGDRQKARKMWEEALIGFRDINDKNNSAKVLLNIGGVQQSEGDLAGAKKTYSQALSIARQVNDQESIGSLQAALGSVLDAEGDYVGAKRVLDKAVAMDLALGRKSPTSDKLVAMGDLLQHQGDLTAARKSYEDALLQSRATGDKSMAAYALMGLGSIAMNEADFAEARKDFEDSLASRNELGERGNSAATRVALANLAIEEGHFADATSAARDARDQLRREALSDEEIISTVVLARALLSGGEVHGAARELDQHALAAHKSQNFTVQMEFGIENALVEAALGKQASAETSLKTLLARAKKAGFASYELKSRLALEEIAMAIEHPGESRARIEQLEKDANAKGFILIARKCAADSKLRNGKPSV